MPVRVHHLRGEDAWLRCDHQDTRLHAATGTIRLALRPVPGVDDADPLPWVQAWVGAFAPAVHPGTCEGDERPWRLGDRTAGAVVADDGTWRSTGLFTGDLRALVDDGCGRMWGLIAGGTVARATGEDGETVLDVPVPFAARWLAVSTHGLYAAGPDRIAFGRWDRPWVDVVLPVDTVVGGIAAAGAHITALARTAEDTALLRLEGRRLAQTSRIGVQRPTAIAVDPEGRAWISTVTGPPPRRTRFEVFEWSGSGASRFATYEAGRIDGRGLLFVDGETWASTPTGWVRAYRVSPRVRSRGRVETFALDSERHGCVWHRVFLDVCLPEGTRVHVSAKTSDEAPQAFPVGDVRPRPPAGADQGLPPPSSLGSLAANDVEGWVEVGELHQQALFADAPDPPRGELPALDPLPRGAEVPTAATHTLEGLLKNGPGRYLWLRIELVGRKSASPVLAGVRVHAPRPSMLAFLPAWWRADPEAKGMDELLALFEAPLSRIEDRVVTLPALFDPRATAPEALDWLASFVGLLFEPQLPERIRRTLLAEATQLYRRRGTVPALERLCTILSEAPVRVVEGWRTRAAMGGILGDEAALMGSTLELGGELDPTAEGTDDAIRAWFGRYAHRFQVIVHRPCTPWLQGILQRAIELNKPAHTVHELCFADGMAVGTTAVGVTTLPAPTPAAEAAVVDEAMLGATTLSRGPAALPPPPLPPLHLEEP